MIITFKEDFRKFKKGLSIDFDFEKYDIIVLLGKNGSGKSTIGYCIQNLLGSFKKRNYLNVGGFIDEYKKAVEITDTDDINVIDTLCSVRDNPDSLSCSADAESFFDSGGFATKKCSHGNKLSYMFTELLKRMEKVETPVSKYNLLVIDEIDSGFDMNMQYMFGNHGLRNISYNLNVNKHINIINKIYSIN